MGLFQSIYRFVLLPSAVGLVCSGCQVIDQSIANKDEGDVIHTSGKPSASTNDDLLGVSDAASTPDASTPDASIHAESTVAVVEAASVETASSSAAATAAYREAINLASSAYHLSQTAVSPDDWRLIASRWQRAADLLKKVSNGDEQYAIAQQKRVDYRRHAEQATDRLQALEQSAQTALPTQQQRSPKILSAPSAVAGAQTPVAELSSQTGVTHVSMVRRLHGTPVVRVLFNGERSYDMILDTGASRTLITQQMADELGVVETQRMMAATASAAEVSFGLGQVHSIALGNVTLQDAQVGIGDAVSIGLLGNDFLSGYDVTIRDRTNTVELSAAE